MVHVAKSKTFMLIRVFIANVFRLMISATSRAEPRPPPGGRSGVKPIARFVLLQNICSPIRLQY